MNDPLDELVSIRNDLKTVQSGFIHSYECYLQPDNRDLWRLSRIIDRLDRSIQWIEDNTPEVSE